MQALWRLNHAIEQLSKRMELHLGVTAQQRMMVRWIGKHPGITPGQLAASLHLDAGTVSAALRRMEERDLVVRRRDSGDGRRVVIELTRTGRALDRPTAGTVERAIERLLRRRAAEDLGTAMAVLADLTDELDATQPRNG